MQSSATQDNIRAVVNKIEEAGLHAKQVVGEELTTIGALGNSQLAASLGLEGMDGVDKVVPVGRPYKLSAIEMTHNKQSVFDIGGVKVGGDNFCLIAGPCTVESRESTLLAAQDVASGGASMLRAGAFKPRTSPFAFQGMGLDALPILKEAKELTNLPLVSELMDPTYSDDIADIVDVIQIGARNMQNYTLLSEVGRLGKPVLLKRGLSSSVEELLQAADYILKEGNEQVILCERGIRTFETATRFTLDLTVIPWLKMHSHLPVIVDPSHAAGDRRFVPALSAAAAAVGADGIIVEVARDPLSAKCDGPQQIAGSEFAKLVDIVSKHLSVSGKRIS